ncbi:alpha/beta hydrolase [Hydrogenophaga bisanensis]|uniref:Alpha/beta hydrolase n=1 Tax=Hydrogenophaga bisanensis TaxID=439611 RepID=A0ABW2R787_9BURK
MKHARTPDPAWLDSQYDNRALVPDHAIHFSRWQAWSADARRAPGVLTDVAYGHGPGETLDLFLPPRRAGAGLAPVMVFIHGGYWRSLDKADHSFVAKPFVEQGAVVVVPNYALCPSVTIPDIAVQMVRALAWTWHHIATHGGDPDRITVAGHSAGGHLAAMLLGALWPQWDADLPASVVRNALSISGLFDLEPLRHTPFLQESLRLTPAQVRKASPSGWPAPSAPAGRGTLACVAGGDESAEFLRQNTLLQKAWGSSVVPVCETLPGLNHFSVLEALVDPSHRLHRMALDLLQA